MVLFDKKSAGDYPEKITERRNIICKKNNKSLQSLLNKNAFTNNKQMLLKKQMSNF